MSEGIPNSEFRIPHSDLAGGFAANSALPFKTQDAILAQCLRIAGIKETASSPIHIYDAEILFKIGGGQRDVASNTIKRASRFAGLTSIEAARKAWKEKARGRVEYHFEHSEILEPLLKAYADQEKRIEEDEGDVGDAIRDVMRRATGRQLQTGEFVLDEREALLRMFCMGFKLRTAFIDRWKEVIPVLLVPLDGETSSQTTPDGTRIQKYPGGKLVRIDASDDLLRRMKLL